MKGINNIILFDGQLHDKLLPLTFTRPVAALRIGITSIIEKWKKATGSKCSYLTQDYLLKKFPTHLEKDSNLFILGGLIPNKSLVKAMSDLKPGEALVSNEEILAYLNTEATNQFRKKIPYKEKFLLIQNPWDIFALNDQVLRYDFKELTIGRKSKPISSTNTVLGDDIFIEEGASCECSTLNSTTGPIYIGQGAEIMEGSIVRGPLAMCEHATLKLGTKIYGATTIGPYCKIGGEVHNSVFSGYSSKAHDGFIGNAVLGEWCNLGADTNNSNLKNNYDKVKLWSYASGRFTQTGLQFCGLIMGDHSKCGINTMFNTGTVVGVSANIFGSGFPRNFIPSFSWGGPGGFIEYKTQKAFETAKIAMARRNKVFDEQEEAILNKVHELTAEYRKK